MSDEFDKIIRSSEFGKIMAEVFPVNDKKGIVNHIEEHLMGTNLFGTLIVDSYEQGEEQSILESLNVVCNKKDIYSFDCYGLYFFWDFDTKEILYVGISNNLLRRFAQHNGLIKVKDMKGTKYKQICDYFKTKKKIGYSILVQTPFKHNPNSFFFEKDEETEIIEGALLEEYKQTYSNYPAWNKIGSVKLGRKPAFLKRYGNIFKMVTLTQPGFLNSKSTLSEIAIDKEIRAIEFDLNGIRSHMYKYGWDFESAIENLQKFNMFMMKQGDPIGLISYLKLNYLRNSDYLKKRIVL